MSKHQLRACDYVNRPYQEVRDLLFAGPLAFFHQATAGGRGDGLDVVELRAKAGPLTVGHEVAITAVTVEDGTSPEGRPGERFVLEWEAVRRPALFPRMRATLTIYPLTATETQLDLAGTYDPPLGWLGDALDAIAMHKIAEESVNGFVHDVAARLRQPAPAAPVA